MSISLQPRPTGRNLRGIVGQPTERGGEPFYDPSQRIAPPIDAMALHGLRGSNERKYVATTNANHGLPVAPNLPARNFTAADRRLHLHGDGRGLAFP
jgi:hypothetical protein